LTIANVYHIFSDSTGGRDSNILSKKRDVIPTAFFGRLADHRSVGGPRVAGVQTEANSLVAKVIPQPGNGIEMPGHGMIAAGAAQVFSAAVNQLAY